MVAETRTENVNVIRSSNALETVINVASGETKLEVAQEFVTGARREDRGKVAVSSRGEARAWRPRVERQRAAKAERSPWSDAPGERSAIVGSRGRAEARLGEILDQVSDIDFARNEVSRKDLQPEVDAIC